MVTIVFHKGMTLEKWATLPASKQVLNIASELGRAESMAHSGLGEALKASLERVLELVDLTVEVNLKNHGFVREMLRFRELVAGIYVGPLSKPSAGEFKSLTKALLSLEPGAYNLLGVAIL